MKNSKKKPYEFGLLVGRFQMLHLGHEDMIRRALGCAEQVAVLIGSSNECGTAKNPFSYELRAELLRKVFGDRILIAPLPDIHLGNVPGWGEYVLETCVKEFGRMPDLFITGKEPRRESWFTGPNGRGIAELEIPKTIEVSASEERKAMLRGDRAAWEAYTNPALHPEFERLRAIVEEAQSRTETGSI